MELIQKIDELCLSLSGKPALYEDEYKHIKNIGIQIGRYVVDVVKDILTSVTLICVIQWIFESNDGFINF